MGFVTFNNEDRAEILLLIKAGLDNMDAIVGDLTAIQRVIDHPEISPRFAGSPALLQKAAEAADIPAAWRQVDAARERLQVIQRKMQEHVGMTDKEAEELCDVLDVLREIGYGLKRSSDTFNQVIETAIESN